MSARRFDCQRRRYATPAFYALRYMIYAMAAVFSGAHYDARFSPRLCHMFTALSAAAAFRFTARAALMLPSHTLTQALRAAADDIFTYAGQI